MSSSGNTQDNERREKGVGEEPNQTDGVIALF
jgi:hypothetical protein